MEEFNEKDRGNEGVGERSQHIRRKRNLKNKDDSDFFFTEKIPLY